MNDFIYTVTSITKDGRDSRCFGYYFSEVKARNAVTLNYGGLQECLYEYIVIERQTEGIHAIAEQIQWYHWVGPDELSDLLEEGRWEKCERPQEEGFVGICNWNGVG